MLDRKPQHIGFGTGPQVCLGPHLGGRELATAIREFLAAIPPFRLAPGARTEFRLGMFQPVALPPIWDR